MSRQCPHCLAGWLTTEGRASSLCGYCRGTGRLDMTSVHREPQTPGLPVEEGYEDAAEGEEEHKDNNPAGPTPEQRGSQH